MFSRKSTTLLSYAESAKYAKKRAIVVRPSLDTRPYISRNHTDDMYTIIKLERLRDYSFDEYDIICVDEGQFLTGIGEDAHRLALEGKRVIISALTGDSEMKPWDEVSKLIPYVDEIIKLNAVCSECGCDVLGTFTHYDGRKDSQVVIGDDSSNYSARCRTCWDAAHAPHLEMSSGNYSLI
jgi:thymidine kinase